MLIDLSDVKTEWLATAGPYQIKKIADHYGIYEHLFGDAYFIPRVPLTVSYEKNDYASPVYYGNIIKPSDATDRPVVTYESDQNSLWTLILTNPDGHLTKENAEYCHWFV